MNQQRQAGLPPLQGLRLIPLGGLGEIGMNCMALEWADEILVIDCGLLFSDLDHFGVEFVVPDFTYLLERKEKVKGFVITHGHEDHIGALSFALRAGIRAPIYASPFSSLLIRSRLEEAGVWNAADLRTFKIGETLKFNYFSVETISVNHSIIDAAALVIQTPVGKVVHTGDFKVDTQPFIGKKLDEKVFQRFGDEGVLLLLSDSTNVERHEHSMSESVIYQKFEELLAAAEGLTVIAMFASNVARVGQVFHLAKKMNKRIYLAGRGMDQNSRFAHELGHLKEMSSVLISDEEIDRYPRKDVVVVTAGSQAEPRSGLMRMALGEHKSVHLQEGDLVVMSSRYIPGNEKAIGRMINQMFRQGAHVLYESVHDIHASGHATRPELKQMLEWVRPKYFLPIHGEYRHLVHHRKVAEECGLRPEQIVIAVDGEVVEVEPNRFEKVGKLENTRVLVEGRAGDELSRAVLKDRRHLGEKGVVFALLVRNTESQEILAGPEIITKGLTHESREGWLVEESKKVALQVVERYEDERQQGMHFSFDLQETLRIELRRFFSQNMGKKPIVLPLILDV